MSGNTVCTPLGSTCTASTGGKSTVGHRSETLGLQIAYLALSAARTMLPFKLRIPKIDVVLPLLPFECPMCVYTPAVLLLAA